MKYLEAMYEVIREGQPSGQAKIREIKEILVDQDLYNKQTISLALRQNPHKKLCDCLRMLNGNKRLTVVEVGVNEGQTISHLLADRENTDIFAIEPNTDVIPKLKNKFPNNVRIFNHGLGEVKGEATLYVTKAARNSSQFMPNPDFIKTGRMRIKKEPDGFDVVKTIPFQIITGDDFLIEQKIDNVDLLQLNTQGSEFMILKGFSNSFKSGKIKSILLENDLDKRYLGVKDDFVDQQILLRDNGFALFDILLIRNMIPAGMRRLYPLYVHESININRG